MMIFKNLYDSEISFKIHAFVGKGIEITIGDQSGAKAIVHAETWEEVEDGLIKAAIEHYPNSYFAANYRSKND